MGKKNASTIDSFDVFEAAPRVCIDVRYEAEPFVPHSWHWIGTKTPVSGR